MLNIVYGKVGSGKTKYVNEVLKSLALEGCEDLLLVVPEQFSFSAERSMLEILGPVDANRVEVVMSFSHIAETVRREYGSRRAREIGKREKILLMSMALDSVKDKLKFFSRRASSKGFRDEMLALSDEFKQNAFFESDANKFLSEIESSHLKKKLYDVMLILQSYNALTENRFSDPFDTLTQLYDTLGEYEFFKNKTVAIDGFHSFSRQEMKIIERMISSAKAVYVTVCADSVFGREDESDIFAYPKKTAREIINIAKKYNSEIKLIKAENSEKNIPEDIKFLEENFFRIDKKVYMEQPENIQIFSAKNIEKEAAFVACTIKKILSEGSVRARDITVVSRDGKGYDTEIKAALKKYGVEVFFDKLQSVKIQPLCTYILACLQIAARGMTCERMMRALKTGLTSLTTDEISLLENYALMWGKSAAFQREWTENPRGFGEIFSDEDRQKLENLNRMRKIAAEPVLRFKKAFSEKISGKTAAEEIYRLLIDTHADENLKKIAISLEERGENELALEQERIWDTVMSMLDSFGEVLAEEKRTADEIYDLFDAVISNEEIGVLPQGLDEVLVGNAERTRVSNAKIVFIVGANDGIFPRTPEAGAVFTSRERSLLTSAGMSLNAPILDRIAEERFISYHAVSSAEQKVFVSFVSSSLSGEEYPSEIVTEIKSIFPLIEEKSFDDEAVFDLVFSPLTAFEAAAETWQKNNAKANSLKAFIKENGEYEERAQALDKYLNRENPRINNAQIAEKLYGKTVYLSASRIESFYKCPFQYFCKYGLRALPEEKAEISPRQRGTVVHHCLERLIREYGIKALAEMEKDELLKIISEMLDEFAEITMGGRGNKSVRFEFLFSRFEKTVYELISQIIDEFSVSDFMPIGFEVRIDRDGEIPPYEIELENGKISVRGSIDRVDIMEKGGEKYLRVVDYKTGGKDFHLYEVLEGINMQMLIYLFAATQNGRGVYEGAVPAGVLYKPAKFSQLKQSRYTTDEEIENNRKKDGKYSGLVLLNEDVIYGMDSTASGDVINVKVTEKDEKISFKGSVVSLSHLGKLKKRVDRIIAKMGDELHRGNVDILPYENGGKSACDYCDYKDVCMKGAEDSVRVPNNLKNEEIYAFFDGEDEENG